MFPANADRLSACFECSPVFKGLESRRIKEICSFLYENNCINIVSYHNGQEVFYEHCPEDSDEKNGGALGILMEGRLVISRSGVSENNGNIVLNVLREGGCFGVCSLFSEQFRMPPTVVTSNGNSTVVFISEEGMTKLLLSDNDVCLAYLRFLTGRLCFLNEKLHAFSGSTVNERVAQALLSSAQNGPNDTLVYRGSKAELARRLNIGRASLYRALNTMSEKGILKHDGKYIEILDPESLACCQ